MSKLFNLRSVFLPLCSILCMAGASVFLVSCGEDDDTTQVVVQEKKPLLTHGIVADVSVEGAGQLARVFLEMHDDTIGVLVNDLKDNIQQSFDQKGLSVTVDEYLRDYVWQEGQFLVTPEGDHYNVTFPSKTIMILPQRGEEIENIHDPNHDRIEITHLYSAEVRPTGDPHAWAYKVMVPQKPFSVVMIKDQTPHEILSMSGDTRMNEGIWHTQLNRVVQAESRGVNYEVKLSLPAREKVPGLEKWGASASGKDPLNMTLRIGLAETIGKMVPDENNIWSGSINSNVTNVDVNLPPGMGTLSAYSLDVSHMVNQLDPASYEQFHDAYRTFLKMLREYRRSVEVSSDQDVQGQSEGGAPEQQAQGREIFVNFIQEMRPFLKEGIEGAGMKVDIKDLKYVAPVRVDSPDNRTSAFEIDRVVLSGTGEALHTDAAMLGFEYQIKGLDIDPVILQGAGSLAIVPKEFHPKNLKLGLRLEQVPLQKYLDLLVTQAGAVSSEAENEQNVPFQTQVMALLAEAGTTIHIDENYIGNDIWLLHAGGAGRVNPSAKYKVTGDLDLRVYGLNTLLAALNEQVGAEADVRLQRTLRGSLSALTFMQAFGQQKEDTQSRPYRGYMLNVTEDGKVQLNGTDLQQMLGAAGTAGGVR